MAITFPIAFPTVRSVMSLNWRAVRVDALSQSPFTYTQQVVRHAGQRWEADVTMPPLERAEAMEFIGFLRKLDGRYGTFTFTPPDASTPRGSIGGTPVVNGASQTGSELAITGAPASETGWLLAGDYIQLGSAATTRLHQVVSDANTDGSGNVTLDIWPNLRSSPANAATVVVSGASGLFRLASPSSDYQVDHSNIYGFAFSMVEAI